MIIYCCRLDYETHCEIASRAKSSIENLLELDLSSFNTEVVSNMFDMFRGCSSLKELNLKNFNVENCRGKGRKIVK